MIRQESLHSQKVISFPTLKKKKKKGPDNDIIWLTQQQDSQYLIFTYNNSLITSGSWVKSNPHWILLMSKFME